MSTSTPDRLLLTVADASAALSVSRSTFYARLLGEIKVVRVGRKVLVPRAEIELWLARQLEYGEDTAAGPQT